MTHRDPSTNGRRHAKVAVHDRVILDVRFDTHRDPVELRSEDRSEQDDCPLGDHDLAMDLGIGCNERTRSDDWGLHQPW
jgi:hypothetical protein